MTSNQLSDGCQSLIVGSIHPRGTDGHESYLILIVKECQNI
jgi:hypothetical protein